MSRRRTSQIMSGGSKREDEERGDAGQDLAETTNQEFLMGEGEESETPQESVQESDSDVEARDYWEHIGNHLIRHHVARRRHLFDPNDVVMGIALDRWQLGHVRKSEMITLRGSMAVVIYDEWRVHQGIAPGYGLWTGSTTFTVGRAADELQAEEDDRGRGEDEEHEGGESEQYEPSMSE